MADRKLFEYNLQDAWQMPISSVTILQDQNIVLYSLPIDRAEKFSPQDPKSVEISNEAMEKVKSIITESRVFEIDEVEENMDIFCLDGVINEFYVSNENKDNTVEAFNLSTYKSYIKKYPKAAKLIKLLKDLSKVLVPEGVDKRCFYLGY